MGLTAGAAWGDFDASTTTNTSTLLGGGYLPLLFPTDIAAVNAAGSQRFGALGATGGAEVGYNWQFGNTVFGVEAISSLCT